MSSMMLYYRAIVLSSRMKEYANIPNKLNMPTLILFGAKDTAIHKRIPQVTLDFVDETVKQQSKLVLVEDSAHWITHEKSDLVNAEILKFIQ